jgi:hypothetical protein
VKNILDGLAKGREVRVVAVVEAPLSDEFSERFDEIQIRRVGGQIQQLNAQTLGQLSNRLAFLIAGIIQDHGNRARDPRGQLLKKSTDARRIDVGSVSDMTSSWVIGLSAPKTLKRW